MAWKHAHTWTCYTVSRYSIRNVSHRNWGVVYVLLQPTISYFRGCLIDLTHVNGIALLTWAIRTAIKIYNFNHNSCSLQLDIPHASIIHNNLQYICLYSLEREHCVQPQQSHVLIHSHMFTLIYIMFISCITWGEIYRGEIHGVKFIS